MLHMPWFSMIFSGIHEVSLFVYENNKNRFVDAICHSFSFYAKLFSFTIVKATCCFVISDKIPSVVKQWSIP